MPDAIAEMFGTAVVLPGAVNPHAQLSGWKRYTLLDRGSYEYIEDPQIFGREIVELAERATKRAGLTIRSARALRLLAGDYLLAHHDTLHVDNPVEVTLDLSPAAAAAEVQYRRRGQIFLRVPCVPGTAAVVERGPTISCNHAYLSKRYPDAEVIRLVALLR